MNTIWIKVEFLEQPTAYLDATDDTLAYVLETMKRQANMLGYVIVSVTLMDNENHLSNEDLEAIRYQLNKELDFISATLDNHKQILQRLEKLSNERA